MGYKIFRKHSLKISDDTRTKAAELTLRQSIYPICLVTSLFFLWVSGVPPVGLQNINIDNNLGLLIRSPRHVEQAFPEHFRNH